ncbi:MAG TPA: bifunctional hydroxymethylpyrimidine kinase/phosphomethylpyrimidine kinase [Candidatus Binataceae bacterium]|nr:bifunctional hydroxymethylpyrimidine kinase/phosphomethylpyrimidine kinase [Candidatus Binataceae bacterium]
MTRPASRRVAFTIAGTDPGGGAGIQADIKTFAALQVWGYSVATEVIAQNNSRVFRVEPVADSMVRAQIEAIAAERVPDAAKTGALAGAKIVRVVADAIEAGAIPSPVVDPVMISSSGARLIDIAGERTIRSRLIPLARVLTPNLPEAEALTRMEIKSFSAMREAASRFIKMGARAVVIKGGHLDASEPAIDLFHDGTKFVMLRSERTRVGNVHGTGCAFSAAIAAYLARGASLEDAVRGAKRFVSAAIRASFRIGRTARVLDPFAK